MRFQTVKRIPGRDPELVLGVLEDCLRAISNDVVREGKRITLYGLGPSPRGINRNDTAVIDVKAEDGVTTIDADVRYQASAFLGTAPQDAVVQAKLDRVFEAMLAQLGLERWYSQVHEQASVAVDRPVMQVENAAWAVSGDVSVEVEARENSSLGVVADEPQLAEEIVRLEPSVTAPLDPKAGDSESEPVAEEVGAAESPESSEHKTATVVEEAQAPEVVVPVPAVEKETVEQQKKSIVASPATKPKLELVARTTPRDDSSKTSTSQSAVPLHRESSFEEEDAKRSRQLKWSAWIAAIVVLVVAPAAWLFLPSHLQEETTQPQAQQPTLVATSQAAPVQPVPVPVAAKLPGTDEDPAAVINEWETSMRSGDAAAQAAFYADPVDHYFLRRNVGRNEVVTAKQASIDKRKGVWTVKMERVKVTRPNDSTARVSLIKHYMVQQGGTAVSEWFVPSVLQLVRADGRWQISSERDLGWAPTMDDLEE